MSQDPSTSATEHKVTRLLAAWSHGDPSALEELTPLVYQELKLLAARYLRRERREQAVHTGTLVHEAFLRLVDQREVSWQNRSHFFGIAAQMMRRVLVDHARARNYARRGRGAVHVALDEAAELTIAETPQILAVDQALRELGERYPQAARIVELRFFGGFSESEIADQLAISVPTVKRRWRLARAWLHRYFDQTGQDGADA